MDLATAKFEDIDNYIMSKLVFEESAMAYILKGHIFIESVIEQLLSECMPHPKAILGRGRLSYDSKVDLARALGLLTPAQLSAFKAINKVRNQYAHKSDYQVTEADLSGFKLDWADIQHKAFAAASTKGPDECAKISTIFLCWSAIWLIREPEASS